MTTQEEFFADPGQANKNEPPRDGNGRYLLPEIEGGAATARTRATTLAKTLEDTYLLSAWSQRKVAEGLRKRVDLFARVAAISDYESPDGKRELNEIVEKAKEAAGAGAGANLGTALHAFTERRTHGEPMSEVPAEFVPDVQAYEMKLREYGITELPRFTERTGLCTELNTAGRVDRIFQMPNGELVIGDLKTQRTVDFGALSIAIQLAIYAHFDALMDFATGAYEPMPPVSRDYAVVVHLPVGEAKATLYRVDLRAGWWAAGLAQQVREMRSLKSIMQELRPGVAAVPVASALGPKENGQIPPSPLSTVTINPPPPGFNDNSVVMRVETPPGTYCQRCDTDEHRCPGCGTPTPHGVWECDGCKALDAHQESEAADPERTLYAEPAPDDPTGAHAAYASTPNTPGPDEDVEALLKAYKTKVAMQQVAKKVGVENLARTRANLARDTVAHPRWPELRGEVLGTENAAKVTAAGLQDAPKPPAPEPGVVSYSPPPTPPTISEMVAEEVPVPAGVLPDNPFAEAMNSTEDFAASMAAVNTKAEAGAVWDRAVAAGQHTDELMAIGAKRLQEIGQLVR